MSRKASESLRSLGVELHIGSIATTVDADGLIVRDKEGTQTRYEAATVLWTAGVEAPAVAAALAKATGAERDRAGRIVVQEQAARCRRGCHAVGAVCGSPDSAPPRWTGPGEPGQVPRSRLGCLHIPRARRRVGRPAAAVGLPRLARLAVHPHRAFLTGYRNRVGAILTWWLAFSLDIRRERAFTTREVGIMTDIYQTLPEQAAGRATGG